MFEIHVIWFLLPLGLVALTSWAFIKKMFGIPGREYGSDYLTQTVYCLVLYAISVWFDSNYYEAVAAATGWNSIDPGFARFLIFPGLLLAAAKIQAIVTGENQKKSPQSLRSRIGT